MNMRMNNMTSIFSNKKIGIFLLMTIFVSGCAKYSPKPLNQPVGIVHKKENISVMASRLSALDSAHYFGQNISSYGYQPIQLLIKNKSDKAVVLDAQNIDLELESINRVAKSLYFNTTKRVVLWCIPGLFLWPFFIPAVVDGFRSADANKRISRDLAERALDFNSIITIPPHSVANKVLFVANSRCYSTFNVVLVDRQGVEIPFTLRV